MSATDGGTYVKYVDKRFSADSLALLDNINEVVEEFEAGGYVMTVRQLYYQLVTKNTITNSLKSYNRVQSLISDGRLAGVVSWSAFEDRGRGLKGVRTHDSPGAIVREASKSYRTDLWAGQRFRPEVWVEKEALAGVVQRICLEERVDFFACKGYNSQSEAWVAGNRFREYLARGQTPVVLHLGDHDPSGLDMTRDNRERLEMFAGFRVAVVRLALNHDQVLRYAPPPNPAKMTDSRAEGYVRDYGYESWELDALSPRVIQDLIAAEVARMRDATLWSAALAEEVAERRALEEFADSFGA